ncbi:MAG: DUF2029 domain-containing protein [Anaerolineae bacterium]|nr:DUF2029 domain-containing protein [Anaerolineae bacterium]
MKENLIARNRYLVYASLIVLFFVNYRLPTLSGYFNLTSPSMGVANVDFYAYYRGGQAYNLGKEPYAGTRDGQTYKYPPTMVPLYGMLAKMDYDSARHLWLAIYLSVFSLVLAWAIWSSPVHDRFPILALVCAMLLISYPFAYLIRQGQIDLLVGSLNFASLIAYMQRRKNISALLLALAALIKLNPVFLLITYVVFLRDWKYLIRFTAAICLLILISFLFVSPDWYRAYALEVLPAQTKSDPFAYNQTPLRFFAGDRYLPRLLTICGMGILVLFAWWSGKRQTAVSGTTTNDFQSPQSRFAIMAFFTINTAFTLLFSGYAWIMAYVWFILPLATLTPYLIRNSRWWTAAGMSLALLGTNSVVMEGVILNATNMLGATLCVIFLGATLVKPGAMLALRQSVRAS